MSQEQPAEPWRQVADEAAEAVRAWGAAHPRATFDQLEQAVEERIAPLRTHLMMQAVGGTAPAERPPCPQCGKPMQARGQQERTFLVRGNQSIPLRRPYTVCPGCGTGLFPPR